jgi:FMN phosphatase YigB (HAD superfamily)
MVDPRKAIFIDDSEQHVKGAHAAGIETHWHNPVESDVAIWLAQRGFELPDSAFRKGALPV